MLTRVSPRVGAVIAIVLAGSGCGTSARAPSAGGGSSSGSTGSTRAGTGASSAASSTTGSSGAPDAGNGDAASGSDASSDAATPSDAASSVDATLADAATACEGGRGATLRGRVLDPAGHLPVFGAAVFVPDPAAPLPDLSSVPVQCGCASLYPQHALAATSTDAAGVFTLSNVPAAAFASGGLELVVQVGKWRMRASATPAPQPCATTLVADLRLPRSSAEGDLPHIAISTGAADTLECLPLRMGVDASEYVAGASPAGHVHVYAGGQGAVTAQPTPTAVSALYDTAAHLEANDLVLLSCEGHETTGGGTAPLTATHLQNLYDYVQAGGRAFASHFHYVWFTGGTGFGASNVAGSGNTVAALRSGANVVNDAVAVPVDVDTDAGTPAEGAALDSWLRDAGAIQNGVLATYFVRDNITAVHAPPSVPWTHVDPGATAVGGAPQTFSVDLGGLTGVCGRVMYSDLHATGGPAMAYPGLDASVDYASPGATDGGVPSACAMRKLVPQEEALEFMLLNLTSCLDGTLPPVK